MAGKGSKSRITDVKKFKDNFPKTKREVEGFKTLKGGKQRKVY